MPCTVAPRTQRQSGQPRASTFGSEREPGLQRHVRAVGQMDVRVDSVALDGRPMVVTATGRVDSRCVAVDPRVVDGALFVAAHVVSSARTQLQLLHPRLSVPHTSNAPGLQRHSRTVGQRSVDGLPIVVRTGARVSDIRGSGVVPMGSLVRRQRHSRHPERSSVYQSTLEPVLQRH